MIKIKRARDLLQTEFLRCYSPVPYFGGDEGRSERDVLFFVSRKGMFFTRGDGATKSAQWRAVAALRFSLRSIA